MARPRAFFFALSFGACASASTACEPGQYIEPCLVQASPVELAEATLASVHLDDAIDSIRGPAQFTVRFESGPGVPSSLADSVNQITLELWPTADVATLSDRRINPEAGPRRTRCADSLDIPVNLVAISADRVFDEVDVETTLSLRRYIHDASLPQRPRPDPHVELIFEIPIDEVRGSLRRHFVEYDSIRILWWGNPTTGEGEGGVVASGAEPRTIATLERSLAP